MTQKHDVNIYEYHIENELRERIKIIIEIDADSYRCHAQEMEGKADLLASYLKLDAENALVDMDMEILADRILHGPFPGTHYIIIQQLRDQYNPEHMQQRGETLLKEAV